MAKRAAAMANCMLVDVMSGLDRLSRIGVVVLNGKERYLGERCVYLYARVCPTCELTLQLRHQNRLNEMGNGWA